MIVSAIIRMLGRGGEPEAPRLRDPLWVSVWGVSRRLSAATPRASAAPMYTARTQEITAALAPLPDDPLPDVADVDFPIALRGYDRLAVDAYVKRTSQLVAELQATRSPESIVRRALGRVGEEISGILQRAHETAEQLTAQSRIEAENRLD